MDIKSLPLHGMCRFCLNRIRFNREVPHLSSPSARYDDTVKGVFFRSGRAGNQGTTADMNVCSAFLRRLGLSPGHTLVSQCATQLTPDISGARQCVKVIRTLIAASADTLFSFTRQKVRIMSFGRHGCVTHWAVSHAWQTHSSVAGSCIFIVQKSYATRFYAKDSDLVLVSFRRRMAPTLDVASGHVAVSEAPSVRTASRGVIKCLTRWTNISRDDDTVYRCDVGHDIRGDGRFFSDTSG